jgi:Asp-tRNA(Asn)/Glu-tRNA(Gln) amidotransferase A subunit family amidase
MMRKFLVKRMTAVMTAFLLAAGSLIPVSVNAAEVENTVISKTEQLESMFTTLDLMDASIAELTEAMENGSLTSEELVQMYIDRINAYDKSLDLNSIIAINPSALEDAREADKERAEGNVKGRLHGIPIIVKDNYDVAGMATSAGSVALKDSIATEDAAVIKKLKDEGAIILAKANMSEFALSGATSVSSLGGTVHNAYDNTRTAAGSSGGTAVAITSNFAAAGLGTDTGSSIRRPSSFSNLYGLRTSLGLSSRDGVVPLTLDRDVTGPMTRNVEDLALLLDIMSGTDENDAWTADADSLIPEEGYTSYLNADGLEGKKIGYLMDSFGYYYDMDDNELSEEDTVALDDKIAGMVETAKENLEAGGAELVDISELLPNSFIKGIYNCYYVDTFVTDINSYLAGLGDDAPCKSFTDILATGQGTGYISDFSSYEAWYDYYSTNLREDDYLSDSYNYYSSWYDYMVDCMTYYREEVTRILEENGIDAVIFVSQTDVAALEEDATTNAKNNAAAYINAFGPVAGLPEMMLPMGLSETDEENGYNEEMPLGMSMFTGYGNDETLIEIAYAYEQIADVRVAPENLPALVDEDVLAFYNDLTVQIKALDATLYTTESYQALSAAYTSVEDTDLTDMEQLYDAALTLAKAYDTLETVVTEDETQTTQPESTAAIEKTEQNVVKAEEMTEKAKEETASEITEEVVKTGDSANTMFYAAMMISMGMIVVVTRKKQMRR